MLLVLRPLLARAQSVTAMLLFVALILDVSFGVRHAHAAAPSQPYGEVAATVETDPVLGSGDAADDPAIWYNAADPARSLVIGNDKQGAIEVYDLNGDRTHRIADGFYGNVDVRQNVNLGAGSIDLVVAWHRTGIRVFTIDAQRRRLVMITDTSSGIIGVPTGGEGLCLYRSAGSGRVYAFVNARNGQLAQYELLDNDRDGRIEGQLRRSWDVGSETEGCVADDELGDFYISEEAVGVWKYGAEPNDPYGNNARELVDGTRSNGGRIRADAEGLTIVYRSNGRGYLIVSSQAASNTANSYMVYERQGGNDYVREFKVVNSSATDNCGRTDGIDALAVDLGPGFRQGMFICQDNGNTSPASGKQNFKFVPLERVVSL
jgi:myo-inositol-hexaphosphate 3-phosphohydrolase